MPEPIPVPLYHRPGSPFAPRDQPEPGEASKTASPENPVYHKQSQDDTVNLWFINVDEGWRSWILCADMYEWAADRLLEVLRASGATWPR